MYILVGRTISYNGVSVHLSLMTWNPSRTVPQGNTPELTSQIQPSTAARASLSTLVWPLVVPSGSDGDRAVHWCIWVLYVHPQVHCEDQLHIENAFRS